MSDYFYTALGTPLDDEQRLVEDSLMRHVEDQVSKGAQGLLVMGSMGMQPMIPDREYVKVAHKAVEAARGEALIYVGVTDNSLARVRDRIDSLSGLVIDGVVATLPFYFKPTQEEALTFFSSLADTSPYPLFLYDLPSVTQCKLQASTVMELMAHPNIAGIKTGDLTLARQLHLNKDAVNPRFDVIYSGLDTFDAAYAFGIKKHLDGMFSCTGEIALAMYTALNERNIALAGECLDYIVGLRDVFVHVGVLPGFTCAMNILGFEGNFHPDYAGPLSPQQEDQVRTYMQEIGMI